MGKSNQVVFISTWFYESKLLIEVDVVVKSESS